MLLGGAGAAEAEVGRRSPTSVLGDGWCDPVVCPTPIATRLIARREALVFPSEYEGFGAPVVEAMALGTPVVCSDHPALREVVGDAAIVLPDDVDAWAGALDEVDAAAPSSIAAGRGARYRTSPRQRVRRRRSGRTP